jgi:hypothetical protein
VKNALIDQKETRRNWQNEYPLGGYRRTIDFRERNETKAFCRKLSQRVSSRIEKRLDNDGDDNDGDDNDGDDCRKLSQRVSSRI